MDSFEAREILRSNRVDSLLDPRDPVDILRDLSTRVNDLDLGMIGGDVQVIFVDEVPRSIPTTEL